VVGGKHHAPAAFTPGKKPGTHCTGGWVGHRPVWTCEKNLAPTGIRSPDRPARSQSLYRLSYPGPWLITYFSKIQIIFYNKVAKVRSRTGRTTTMTSTERLATSSNFSLHKNRFCMRDTGTVIQTGSRNLAGLSTAAFDITLTRLLA
jgi:hypothetical protein